MSEANLTSADLSGADLRWAHLTEACLIDANLTGVQYNADTKWPEGFDPQSAGAVLVDG